MKKLHYLLCAGLLAATVASCSKDEDDDLINEDPLEESDDEDPEEDNSNGGSNNNQGGTTTKDSTDYYDYYGAELLSKETFKYGRFEAKMKMAYAPGCISSMFLYYNDSYKGGSYIWNEIDIEVIGKKKSAFQSNIITGNASKKVTSEAIHEIGAAVYDDYHIYTIEWTPEYVSWMLDGKEMRRTETSDDTKKQVAALVEEQSLRFNLWASESSSWVGYFNEKNIPVTQYIDYVKVYDYDTESGEFNERWTDEFDTFDTNRWGKGNWQMELVYERTQNVVVENGVLELRMTKVKKSGK